MGLLNEPAGQDQNTEMASQEEQKEYDEVVHTALAFMFDKDSNAKIVEMMRNSDDPSQVVANLTVSVGEAYESRNGKISDEVAPDAAEEIIEVLFDLGEKAGAWETTDDDLENALYRVYEMWGESHQGDIQANSQEMTQQFQSLPQEVFDQAMGHFARKNPMAQGVQDATGAY